jgi:hypothetical protein
MMTITAEDNMTDGKVLKPFHAVWGNAHPTTRLKDQNQQMRFDRRDGSSAVRVTESFAWIRQAATGTSTDYRR